ncbi:hypothetical protein G3488_12690 [Shewanella baltica]|nr:hypothetical protein [Shewanella baltica]MCS6173177.1 hypothetical protein [Shewanella baltica]MCS6203890.1 hypothetical protein [Shewanella baltica]MCS6231709.1 hypothetical protein [Shewanella baltica]
MTLKSPRPLLMCDLDLSISKEVFKARGKNDFRSKKQRIFKRQKYKERGKTSLFSDDKTLL